MITKLAITSMALALTCPGWSFGQTIEGTVTDEQGKPISGVEVTVRSVGSTKPVASTKTDGMGKYKLQLAGRAFDIWYTHTKLETGFVTRLSGAAPQSIHKLLYLKGNAKNPSAVQAKLDAADRALFLLAVVPRQQRNELKASFAESGYSIQDAVGEISGLQLSGDDIGKFHRAKVQAILAQMRDIE